MKIGEKHYFTPNMFYEFHFLDNHKQKQLAQLEIDKKWGYIDINTSEIAITPVWDRALPFSGNYATVWMSCFYYPGRPDYASTSYAWEHTDESRCGFINTNGEVVIPIHYMGGYVSGGLFIVRKPHDTFWGVIDIDENVIIDFIYPNITRENHAGFNGFIIYTKLDEGKSLFHRYFINVSFFSPDGCLIRNGMLKHNANYKYMYMSLLTNKISEIYWQYDDYVYNREMINLIIKAMKERFYIIEDNEKFGIIADNKLLLEPVHTLNEICRFIENDIKENPLKNEPEG